MRRRPAHNDPLSQVTMFYWCKCRAIACACGCAAHGMALASSRERGVGNQKKKGIKPNCHFFFPSSFSSKSLHYPLHHFLGALCVCIHSILSNALCALSARLCISLFVKSCFVFMLCSWLPAPNINCLFSTVLVPHFLFPYLDQHLKQSFRQPIR